MLPPDLQLPQSRLPITLSRLLIVEGHDAFQFFKAMLRHLDLLDTIEVRNFGGLNDLASYLQVLPTVSGFTSVTSLGIICDAETDASQTFAAVCRYLKRANLGVPSQPLERTAETPNVSVFILPDGSNPGALETLCLQAVSGDPIWQCVEDYFACVKRQGANLPNNMLKARVHAFLASRPRPNLLLGQAAHEGYWHWESPAFDQLKSFLRAM